LDLGLQGRVAAVTGGSHGVGYAIAQALLAEGCRVAICARDKARLDAAAQSLGHDVFAQTADVAKPGEVEGFVQTAASHFGGLDILVHNAGGGGGASLGAPDAEFSQAIELNVLAGLRAARAAVPLMRTRGHGRIIFIASVYGRESGGRAGYNVAKAAEISLAKALSRELAKDKILVNSVAPGSLMFPGRSAGHRRLRRVRPAARPLRRARRSCSRRRLSCLRPREPGDRRLLDRRWRPVPLPGMTSS